MTLTWNRPGPIQVSSSSFQSSAIRKRETRLLADLFADGDDFSTATIERRRNLFEQNKLKETIENEMQALSLILTAGLNIHLTLNQTSLINTSSIVVSTVKLPISSFLNQTLSDQQVTFPSQVNLSANQSQSLQVRLFSLRRNETPLYCSGEWNDWPRSTMAMSRSRRISLGRSRCRSWT